MARGGSLPPGASCARALMAADPSARTGGGETCLHLAARLPGEAKQAAKLATKVLVQACAGVRCGAGRLPLHAASQHNSTGLLGLLLEHSPAQLDSQTDCPVGSTALHLAAQAGSTEALEQLLLAGADANVRRRSDGRTALHLAATAGHVSAVQQLLNHGADAEKAAFDGETPSYTAAAAGQLPVLLRFAQHDAGLLTLQPDQALRTPLHALAAHGHATILEDLLQRPQLLPHGALSLRDGRGHTLLGAACAAGHAAVAQLLLGHQRGQLPLGEVLHALGAACAGGHVSTVRLMLEHLAEGGQRGRAFEELAALPYDAHPWVLGVRRGQLAVVKLLLEEGILPPAGLVVEAVVQLEAGKKVLWALLEASYGAGRNLSARDTHALFTHALRPGQALLLSRLLAWGLDPNAHLPGIHSTPLLRAASGLNHEALRLLLQHGADPQGQQGSEQAPLHAAARMLDLKGARLLLAAGADPAAKTARGRTALDLVLETCTDEAAIELTGRMWPEPRAFTERQLLQLVEALVAAGSTCAAFLEDHPDPASELVYPTLLLPVGWLRWSPKNHSRWPPKFKAACRALLGVARARGVASGVGRAEVERSGCMGAGQRPSRSRLAGMLGRGAAVRRPNNQAQRRQQQQQEATGSCQGIILPLEVCWAIMEFASREVSAWV